jgi:hypothetical protein
VGSKLTTSINHSYPMGEGSKKKRSASSSPVCTQKKKRPIGKSGKPLSQ